MKRTSLTTVKESLTAGTGNTITMPVISKPFGNYNT